MTPLPVRPVRRRPTNRGRGRSLVLETLLPAAKECDEGIQMATSRRYFDRVNAGAAELPPQLFVAPSLSGCERGPHLGRACVDKYLRAGLGVHEVEQADGG